MNAYGTSILDPEIFQMFKILAGGGLSWLAGLILLAGGSR